MSELVGACSKMSRDCNNANGTIEAIKIARNWGAREEDIKGKIYNIKYGLKEEETQSIDTNGLVEKLKEDMEDDMER